MNYRFLSKKAIPSFVTNLLEKFKVYGPIELVPAGSKQGQDGFPMYDEIKLPKDLTLLHTATHLSPKKYIFPQKETLLRFRNGATKEMEPVVEADNQVLFGIHSCDIHAIKLLDRVFAYGTPDINYLKKREKTIIIGTDCIPDKYCFCKSINTMTVDSGFDLFLHDIGTGFLAEIGTEKGKKLLSIYTKTRKAENKEIGKIAKFQNKKATMFTASINTEASSLPLLYSNSYNSHVWEKIGKICYGCGSCNLVCPSCYCFDVRDDMESNLKQGLRYRVWDACLLEDFTKVAGGHNFRKTRAERLRHRFNRKFQYQVDRFGGLFCVGCGRCSRTCLVNINIVEVTNALIEESNNR